jgi:uncharacterized membrane protein YhfC
VRKLEATDCGCIDYACSLHDNWVSADAAERIEALDVPVADTLLVVQQGGSEHRLLLRASFFVHLLINQHGAVRLLLTLSTGQ